MIVPSLNRILLIERCLINNTQAPTINEIKRYVEIHTGGQTFSISKSTIEKDIKKMRDSYKAPISNLCYYGNEKGHFYSDPSFRIWHSLLREMALHSDIPNNIIELISK